MGAMPPLVFMPYEVIESMQKRVPESRISEIQCIIKTAFFDRENKKFTLIIPEHLGDMHQRTLPCSDFFGAHEISYADEEYEKHCMSIRETENTNDDYKIVRVKNIPSNLMIVCSEGHGVIMAKTDAPSVAFIVSEQTLTNAFWDYLVSMKNGSMINVEVT